MARLARGLTCAAAALLLGAPPAFPEAAGAPTPSISITGFIDSVTSWSKNMSVTDRNLMATGDREWYSRNRGRFDIIGQIDHAKAVFGFEIDTVWGTTALTGVDNNLAPGGGAQHFAATSAFDLNTDTQGSIEVKWLYTEFPLPLLPVPTIVRLGAQPFEVTYKPGVYATGDFAGVHLTSALTRNVALYLTYVQVEEDLTGRRRNLGFGRGDDFAVIGSVAVTPVRGLDVRPMYSYFFADGTTSFSARQMRGGLGIDDSPVPDNTNPRGFKEHRHTIGVDARWSSGPFFLDPTVLYQFGTREINPSGIFSIPAFGQAPAAPNPYENRTGKFQVGRSAWLVDVRGGWRYGSLLLEGAAIYTTGNTARQDTRSGTRTLRYFEPLDTDTSFYSGWAEIFALGIDYFNVVNGPLPYSGPPVGIGYDKYGLARVGSRASYELWPGFTLRAAVAATWTANPVDTSGVGSFAGLHPRNAGGTSSYLGTEVDVGITWTPAPGLTFDLVGAYLWAGQAFGAAGIVPGPNIGERAHDPKDVKTIVARVRFAF